MLSSTEYLSHSSSRLFGFSHGARFRKTIELIDPQHGQTVLDYGCADGRLLNMLPGFVRKIGFDPNPRNVRGVQIVQDTACLDRHSCDVITVCEVFEHLSAAEVNRALVECRRLLKPHGKLIVSVPIEVGASALVKSIARWIKVRPLELNMTLANVLKSTFYLPVERIVDSYNSHGEYYGHIGFDYRRLKFDGLTIKRKLYSPLPLGPVLNSQVFYVLTPST